LRRGEAKSLLSRQAPGRRGEAAAGHAACLLRVHFGAQARARARLRAPTGGRVAKRPSAARARRSLLPATPGSGERVLERMARGGGLARARAPIAPLSFPHFFAWWRLFAWW